MQRANLSVLVLLLSFSCASPSAQHFAGYYERVVPLNGGGELELRFDGTYTFSWEDIADIVEADGSLFTSSDVEHGRWMFTGVHVVFSPSRSGRSNIATCKLYGAYILDAANDLRPAGGKSGERFRRTTRPNKSLQPTATAVTLPAGAGSAPAVAVAEH